MPVALVLSRWLIGGSQGPLFAAFGSFALLAMTDFRGTLARRLAAYASASLLGAALVALGTPCSQYPVVAGIVMLLVGFAIRFGGSFGAQPAAGVTAMTLAFVLSVAVEVPVSAVGDRLAGWGIASAIAIGAAMLLWPERDRGRTFGALGEIVDRFAAGGLTDPDSDAGEQLAAFRASRKPGVMVYAATLREERCFRRAVSQLERLERLLPLRVREGPDDELLDAMRRSLAASAAMLTGSDGADPDPEAVERARIAHREALDRETGERLAAGEDPESVLAAIDATFRLRVASLIVVAIATNVLLLLGRSLPAEQRLEMHPELDLLYESRLRAGMRLARAWLRPGSARLQDAVRASAGLALAVFIADAAAIDHGFWVVLATLVVLRSNARGTGHTAFRVIGGTLVGFLVASLLVLAVGTGQTGLWAALPFVVFAAVYLPAVYSIAAGQAAFAVFVVVLFNLFVPIGWKVGLVRVEDVVLGAAISVAIGLLLWPRGATTAIRNAAARGYRATGAYLAAALGEQPGEARDATREEALTATILTADAIDQHRTEPGPQVDEDGEFALLDGPRLLRAAADGWVWVTRNLGSGAVATPALAERGRVLLGQIEATASGIERAATQPAPASTDDLERRMHDEAIAALADWGGRLSAEAGPWSSGALKTAWERDWLRLIGREMTGLDEDAVRSARALDGSRRIPGRRRPAAARMPNRRRPAAARDT